MTTRIRALWALMVLAGCGGRAVDASRSDASIPDHGDAAVREPYRDASRDALPERDAGADAPHTDDAPFKGGADAPVGVIACGPDAGCGDACAFCENGRCVHYSCEPPNPICPDGGQPCGLPFHERCEATRWCLSGCCVTLPD